MRVRWRPEAVREAESAADYYDDKRAGLGAEFLACITEAVGRARRQPMSFAEVDEGVRRVLARRFPFSVFFMLHQGALVVLAVGHARRAPGLWRRD